MKRLLVLVALLLVFAAPAFAYYCYDGAQGAGRWWTFDNAQVSGATLIDVCVGTNGTIDGATTGQAGASAVTGQSFYCDGTNDRIYSSNKTSVTGADSFSWCGWSKGQNTTGVWYSVFEPSSYSTGNGQILGITYDIGDKLYSHVKDTGGQTVSSNPAGDMVDNVWHHHCITYNGATMNLSVYRDGAYLTSTGGVGIDTAAYQANSYYVVCSQRTAAAGFQYPWQGWVDEMAFFYYTLPSTEVFNVYTYNTVLAAGKSVTLSSPANNSYDNASFEDTWYFTPTWVAPGAVLANCSLFANSTYVASNTTLTSGANNSIAWSPTTEGQYSWYVSCYDSVAGTWDTNSSAFLFYYDTTNPSATVYSPVYGGTYYAGTATTVNVTYTDTRNMATCAYEIFDNMNVSFKSNSTACTGTSYNWATDSFTPDDTGTWYLNVTSTDSAGNSAVVSSNFTVNGISVDVFNEKTFAAITCWNMTMTNSTGSSYTTTCQNNTWVWSNFSTVPTGSVAISLSAVGYVGRTYYRTYQPGIAVSLDAYLLDTSSGVYSYFLVQSATGTALYGAQIVFTFQNGTSWLTAGEVITDSTGSATMWLDWTKSYLVTTSLTGYTTVTKTITPQPTTYINVMGSASVFNYSHLNDTLWTFIDPTDPGVNITTDSITAGLLDPDSGITICGLNLTYLNGTVFSSTNTTTEQYFCMNTIPLLGSGAPTGEKFYATLWYTVNGTDSSWTRLYNPLAFGSSLDEVQSGMFNYLGSDDARLILAVLVTLFSGAAAAMYLGIGATVIMMAVSGLFFYWGWFAGYELLYIITFVAGAALLYLETRT